MVLEISRLDPEDMVTNLTNVELLVLSTDTSPFKTTVGVVATTLSVLPLKHILEEMIKNVTKVEWVKEEHGEMLSIKTHYMLFLEKHMLE